MGIKNLEVGVFPLLGSRIMIQVVNHVMILVDIYISTNTRFFIFVSGWT